MAVFETQNNDLLYLLSCGEKIEKIYPMVGLEFDNKLRVALFFFFFFCVQYIC